MIFVRDLQQNININSHTARAAVDKDLLAGADWDAVVPSVLIFIPAADNGFLCANYVQRGAKCKSHSS